MPSDDEPSFEAKLFRPIILAGTLLLFVIPSLFTLAIFWNRKKIKSSSYFLPQKKFKRSIIDLKPIAGAAETIVQNVQNQIINPNYEVNSERIKADPSDEQQVLGRGCFGVVVKGTFDGKKAAIKCAKDVNIGYAEFWLDVRARESLYQEACLLSFLPQNMNVLRLKGAVTKGWKEGGQLRMALELCDDNLQHILLKVKSDKKFINQLCHLSNEEAAKLKTATKMVYQHERGDVVKPSKSDQLTTSDLLSFGYQTSLGMQFLCSYQCLHRDLAPRNILVKRIDDQWIVKICDFGLARQMEESMNYYQQLRGAAQPANWISPEAFLSQKFSPAADVWSYGIVLYELFTLGTTPYGNKTREEIEKELKAENERLITTRPEYCHEELFNFFENCWYYDSTRRPTFGTCAVQLENHLQRANPEQLQLLQKLLFMNE
ncbi:unnamed protein product, partial [Mesorhabditis belari]|uniref:Protein kinase domain-containing protein n=1 Tax=Mesorhabditis belari TaxID=2138241 RepID=A0AAF3EE42_9BILA